MNKPRNRNLSLLILAVTLFIMLRTDDVMAAKSAAITESIGTYTAGCIRNAAPIPLNGEGFQVIRLWRQRYYANPEMIDYIIWLGKAVHEQLKAILVIGDVAQRTGGPMYDEHSSHQIGLDADILYWQHPIALKRELTTVERAHIYPQSVLNDDETGIDEFKWNDKIGKILRIAASDKRVDRIFVNPFIKRRLCKIYPGELWLARIRPWYGHDGHFHVRLKCPKEDHLCQPQVPINIFDTRCGSDLNKWFTAEGKIRRQKSTGKTTAPRLPEECIAIMKGVY
jgi:penicillin-insensitive murein endopeptidase